jgi:hypothetical protein
MRVETAYKHREDKMSIHDEMRVWLLDCFPEDDHEAIQELTHDELENAINRYYDGGMRAFMQGWTMVEA